jgi:plasmid maintenance system killer protein
MNISEHITYREAVFSATAIRRRIDNTPNEEQLRNMKILAEKVFEPLRAGLGNKPIRINSFFRSVTLNHLIGGSITSQHCANNGAAMDIDNDMFGNPDNLTIFNYIKGNLEFDQLINEYPNDDLTPSWVHVSYNEGKNRKQVLMHVNGNYHKI